jgi:1-phosphofructokinase family hexose kinase
VIVTVTPNPVLDRTLTVERIVPDEVMRATAVQLDWGGKGFNVSRALQRLGMESVAMGLVGGATGQMLQQGLHDLGIATDFVTVAGETRTNVVVREADSAHYIKVNETGPSIRQDECQRFIERARGRAQQGDIWVLAGSLPPGVPADFYGQLIRILRQRGARAFLDSSGEALRLGSEAAPTLVKPNGLEAAEVTGCVIGPPGALRPEAALQAARYFLDSGIEFVALSLGADGLLLASRKQAVWAGPPAVHTGNPTGAGDALLAGITWAMVQGLSLEDVARWGVACGTASAAGEGVSAGSREEVEAWHERVETRSQPGWGDA